MNLQETRCGCEDFKIEIDLFGPLGANERELEENLRLCSLVHKSCGRSQGLRMLIDLADLR